MTKILIIILLIIISTTTNAKQEQSESVIREMIKNQKKDQQTISQRLELSGMYRKFLAPLKQNQRKNAYKHLEKIPIEEKGAGNMFYNATQLYFMNTKNINQEYGRKNKSSIKNLNKLIDYWNKHNKFDPIFWINKCKEIGILVQPTKFGEKEKRLEYYDCSSPEWLKKNKEWVYKHI